MATEVIQVPYAVEDGKNADKLIGWDKHPDSVRLEGPAEALGPVLLQLNKVPGAGGPDIPFSFDDFAKALQSDHTILYRHNFRGQEVPKRWYEILYDRPDTGFGILGDYLIGPALNVVGYWMAGYNENEKEAEEFINALYQHFPTVDMEKEFFDNQYKHPSGPQVSTFYEFIKDENNRLISYPVGAIESSGGHPPDWPDFSYGLTLGAKKLVRRREKEIEHEFA